MNIISLGELQSLLQPKKYGIKSRVKIAYATVHLFRTSGVVHMADGLLPPVERSISKQERRAYNNALDLLANYFSGELTDALDVDDDELPGADLATLKPPHPAGPACAGPTHAGPVCDEPATAARAHSAGQQAVPVATVGSTAPTPPADPSDQQIKQVSADQCHQAERFDGMG